MKTKKILCVALALILAVSGLAVCAFAVGGQGMDYGVVRGSAVRFRTMPNTSTDANVICLLNTGDVILIETYTTASGYTWAKGTIQSGPEAFIGYTGYIVTDYLDLYQTR